MHVVIEIFKISRHFAAGFWVKTNVQTIDYRAGAVNALGAGSDVALFA